jgi:NADPH:quinone reductase-like Zn-dependent oxidoreductase
MASETMEAVCWTAYGPPEVLELRRVERPGPADTQILVRVAASNIFPGDCELRRFDVGFPWLILVRLFCGLFRPRRGVRLGQEYAGEVAAVGEKVTRFKPGDRIFGAVEPTVPGSYAEYLVSSGAAAATMPDNLSFEEACAATVGGLNALGFLKIAHLDAAESNKKLLIVGAGGSIGTMAVQIAKAFGAEVDVVDTAHKLDALRALGADGVIDFTKEDFTQRHGVYDVVIDIVGRNVAGRHSLFRMLRTVKPGGYLVLGNAPFRHLMARRWAGLFSDQKVRLALIGYKQADLDQLKQLMASGKVKPVIDRQFALAEAVEAHRYVETGRRIGNVVLTMTRSH